MRFFVMRLFKSNLTILLILLASLILRLYRLGFHELWYDEIFTIQGMDGPLKEPIYYFLKSWWLIFLSSRSEFSVRLLSAVIGVFSVFFIYVLGKNLFNRKAGFLSAALAGLSPFHIWYSQEARDYILAVLFGLLSSMYLLKTLNTEKLRHWILYLLFSLLSVLTNYFCFFLLGAHCVHIFASQKLRQRFGKKIFWSLFILGILFVPFLAQFLNKLSVAQYAYWWLPEPDLLSLVFALENFILGYNGTTLLYRISDIFLFICPLVFFMGPRGFRSDANVRFCLLLFLFPLFGIFMFSKIFFSIFIYRA